MKKEELRKKYINLRKSINNKEEKSKIIASKLLSFDVLKNANVVAIYVSMEEEVSTHEIINYFLSMSKIVCVPLIKMDGSMKFIRIDSMKNLKENKFGILEPENDSVVIKNIDIIIMPGVCFDRYGNRIGFGKGYYDRYLKDNEKIIKIALAFSEQVIKDKIFSENHDIKYDYLITEKEIIRK